MDTFCQLSWEFMSLVLLREPCIPRDRQTKRQTAFPVIARAAMGAPAGGYMGCPRRGGSGPCRATTQSHDGLWWQGPQVM